jgi:hypothetical protein
MATNKLMTITQIVYAITRPEQSRIRRYRFWQIKRAAAS